MQNNSFDFKLSPNIHPDLRDGQDDYDKYTRGEMSLGEMDSFAEHCEQCPVCLKVIAQQHEKENRENELLLSRTRQLLDSLDEKESIEK